jgi:hypothetical protein
MVEMDASLLVPATPAPPAYHEVDLTRQPRRQSSRFMSEVSTPSLSSAPTLIRLTPVPTVFDDILADSSTSSFPAPKKPNPMNEPRDSFWSRCFGSLEASLLKLSNRCLEKPEWDTTTPSEAETRAATAQASQPQATKAAATATAAPGGYSPETFDSAQASLDIIFGQSKTRRQDALLPEPKTLLQQRSAQNKSRKVPPSRLSETLTDEATAASTASFSIQAVENALNVRIEEPLNPQQLIAERNRRVTQNMNELIESYFAQNQS